VRILFPYLKNKQNITLLHRCCGFVII